ncbi:hypothetical protein K491DRAFT_675852 [Lophiostoma macrostomum CBS 122681]|uniref:Uncharacterized protein n=1 Tax=Lophiostoma macrostomum CBS 122681 TaxID=1314788 RepID=A0A6A6TJQ4_9PLEO|nr:hypothetical protein K491DRAFT_675852 [Lophiostoma macrostomum CBS 122681]
MPLPKRQKLPIKAKAADRDTDQKDSRFENFQTDAKFRLPSRKHTKTKLDSRFSRLLTDPEFYNKSTVDRYGRRKDKDAGRKELERFYNIEDGDEEQDSELETEDSRKRDKAVKKELAKVDIRGKGYDPMRDGGFSSSSSDESSSDEEEELDIDVENQAELPEENNEVPTGEVTARLAAVNMDWDNIRAADIMAVGNSFIPADGRILNVVIYPSEFGMDRMQREEIEGPPREIFASTADKNNENITTLDDSLEPYESEDDEEIKKELLKESNGEEFDTKALRAYQLDRLRYYYAVITCSSPLAAKAIYDSMDGREYLSSANFFDLRFVPDETSFDEDPHDECDRLPKGYKPNEFSTDALTHSNVKLTWDADDTTRQEVQKRAFSRKEIDENELQAYLGSESEDEEEETQPDKAAALRAALGLGSGAVSQSKSKSKTSKRDRDFKKPDGEMQVTFSAGLSSNAPKGSVFENEPILGETTVEKYVRKQKERKQKRKERAKALKEGRDPDAEDMPESADGNQDGEEDPWADPFFEADPNAAKALKSEARKSTKAKQREDRGKQAEEEATERANLELLMVDDEDSKVSHFDMNEIIKAEKAKKKSKKKGSKADATTTEEGFELDTSDPRFAKLYESHEYAIDPTNPRYKGTAGMKALLEEGRKKRKRDKDDGSALEKQKKQKPKDHGVVDTNDVKKLVARVKAKSRRI